MRIRLPKITARSKIVLVSALVVVACGGVGAAYGMSARSNSPQTASDDHHLSAPDQSSVGQKRESVGADKQPSPTESDSSTALKPTDGSKDRNIRSSGNPLSGDRMQKRRADSSNPAWVACTAQLDSMRAEHSRTIEAMNNEQNATMKEVDAAYERGEFMTDGDGRQLTFYEQRQAYDITRNMFSGHYRQELSEYNTQYKAKYDTQLAMCDSMYDR